MLCRGGAPGGVAGSSNEVCGVKRARPSVAESNTLKTSASSRRTVICAAMEADDTMAALPKAPS